MGRLTQITLRSTVHAPYTTKNDELTFAEMDANEIVIGDAIRALQTPGAGVPAYAGGTVYSIDSYVVYDSTLWRSLVNSNSSIPEEGENWTAASAGELTHKPGTEDRIGAGTDNEVTAEQLKAYISVASVTLAQLLTLIENSTLVAGRFYKISDRADLGIFLYATSANTLSHDGKGIFMNPDHQGVGDYSDVTTENGFSATFDADGSAPNALLGVWGGTDPSLAGDICIYNGLHYLSKTGVLGSAPDSDSTNWELIPKTAGTNYGYIIEADYVEFDIANDWLITRADKRGNKIKYSKLTDDAVYGLGVSASTLFQWGRNQWYGNTVEEGVINALNFIGIISRNYISLGRISGLITTAGSGQGVIDGNTLINSQILNTEFTTADSQIITCEFRNNSIMSNKTIGSVAITGVVLDAGVWTDVLDIVDPITNETNIYGGKPLTRTLDMTDAAIYSGTTLSIPDGCGAYRKFILQKSGTAAIDDITGGLAHDVNIRFYPYFGLAVDFNYVAVSGAATLKLIGAGAGQKDTIDGSKFQWIEFRYSNITGVYNAYRQYFAKYL